MISPAEENAAMEKRQLGNTDFMITPIGLGAWAMGGGDWIFGWGPQKDEESIAAIRRAVGLGINWIDTAAVYGLGHSEEVVARALVDIPRGERPFVFTKCSLVWDDKGNVSHSLKRDSIRREMEESLRRLRVETIDLYQVHWPGFPAGNESPDLEEGWRALAELKQEGKARFIGASNFSAAQMERAARIAHVSSLQPPYSMLSRRIENEILPYCADHDIGVIVYSPMHSGLLSGTMTRERVASLPRDDWRVKFSTAFQEPMLSRNLDIVGKIRAIGARHGRSPGEVAIAWTLRLPAVTAAIVGARRPSQVDGFVGAAGFRLSDGEVAEIEKILAD
jgi:aryl-alcohol dehydrogenase-like predicted oxidoreductase